jgi:hypothetical protein
LGLFRALLENAAALGNNPAESNRNRRRVPARLPRHAAVRVSLFGVDTLLAADAFCFAFHCGAAFPSSMEIQLVRTLLIAITTCLISAMVAPAAVADLILSDVGVAVTEDFNSFGGTGFSPTPTAGQLDSNTWRATGFSEGGTTFGGTFTTGDFARGVSTGGVTTGGTYAFEVGTNDYALGVQQTADDFTPGRLTLRVLNDTGQAITGFNLQADAYFFNDQNRSSTWSIAFSTTDAGDGSYTVLPPPLLSPAAADATPIWDAIPIFAPIQFAAPLENGEQFYVQG